MGNGKGNGLEGGRMGNGKGNGLDGEWGMERVMDWGVGVVERVMH